MSSDERTHNAEVLQAILATERDRTTIGYALSRFAATQYYTFDEMRQWLSGSTDRQHGLSLDAYLHLAIAPLPASYGTLRTLCYATGANHARVQKTLDDARRLG